MSLDARLQPRLQALAAQELYRRRRVIDGSHGVEIQVDGRRCINFCSNDYLGLAADPRLAAASQSAARNCGTGSGAAALVSGYNREHQQLEAALADYVGRPRALLFSSGWAANLGVIRALLDRDSTLIADELNHASLIDGGRLSGARYERVAHAQIDAYARALAGLNPGASSKAPLPALVATDSVGLQAVPIPMEMTAPEKQFTVTFDDVRVPADRLVGEEGRGLQAVFDGLNPERVMGAAMSLGIARYALDKAVRYAKERSVWGAPIGTHQGIAHPLARVRIALDQAELLVRKAAWMYDNGADAAAAGAAATMAKFAAAEVAEQALDRAIQTHGGNGLATEYGLATLWGITRIWRIAPISEEMTLNHVAQSVLGLPRSF